MALVDKIRSADAHDAGCLGPSWPKYAQLMLMMLAVSGLCGQRHPADVHDACCFEAFAAKVGLADAPDASGLQSTPVRLADAHGAGFFEPLRLKYAQVMLMMLAVSGLGGDCTPS